MRQESERATQFYAESRDPHQKNEPQITVSRREFLRIGASASLGIATGPLWIPQVSGAASRDISRVIVVTDDQVLQGSNIQPDVVRIMIDAGIKALTDADTPSEGWRCLFPDLAADLSIGIKINTINSYLSSHPEVTMAIAESVAATELPISTYPINQLLIWDRWDWELEAAGYTINTSTSGVRCFATDHGSVGYDSSPINVHGVEKWVSRCYSDYSDRLINLCCLKNHNYSGLTFSLKNLYGTVDDPHNLHATCCDPYIPALNAELITAYGPKQRLCVCDALFGIRVGGPMGPPQFTYKGLVLSNDPVALDAICREILNENGCTTSWYSYHIDTAAGPPYNLGNNDLEDLERVDIVNPSSGVHSDRKPAQPEAISLRKSYPEPFSSMATIPVELDHPGAVLLDIHNLTGQRIKILHRGDLPAGKHSFSWNGMDERRRAMPSGRYLIRLVAHHRARSRVMTLVR